MTFNRPQSGGGDVFKPQEHANELVLVWPRDMRYNVTTPTGVSDAMACDIVVLDGPGAGQKYINTLLFSVGLRNNLQSYLGDPNPALGRILHVALQGGKTTWNLADFSDADAENAAAYLQAFPHNPAPVQQQAAPQQQGGGWGAPAPAAAPQGQTQAQAAAAFRGDPALAAPAHVQAQTWGAPAPAGNQWAQPAAAPAAAAPAAAPSWAAPAAAPAPQAYQPPVAVNQGTGEIAAPQAAPAAAAAWSAVDVQNCLRQGLDDATIAQTTGAPLQAVAAIRAAGPQ